LAHVQTISQTISLKPIQQWLTPRSTDRDEAFRERTIRLIALAMGSLTGLMALVSIFLFKDEWRLVSFPSLYFVILFLSFLASIAVNQQRLIMSGQLLVLAALIGSAGLPFVGLRGDYISQLGILPFLLTVVLTHSVLPKSAIWWVSGFSLVLASLIVAIQAGEATPDPAAYITAAVITNGVFLFASALFLYQRATESEDRLQDVRVALSELEKTKLKAEAANQSKSNFLANMSHELRTPLNAIVGYVDILRYGMAGEVNEKQSELLNNTAINNHRLLNLINDLLDIAKIESGKMTVLDTTADPRQIVQEVIVSTQSLVIQKGIQLEVAYTERCPSIVLCDVRKLQQILTNLISNAVKFTNSGGVFVTVDAQDNNTWQLAVRDTGIGMPPDAGSRIFDKFQQLESALISSYKGTGLGLAIVKGFVELMGGSIDLKTELGQGTTFTITLPRDRQKSDSEKAKNNE
jgi:signal transduction histidine kinase